MPTSHGTPAGMLVRALHTWQPSAEERGPHACLPMRKGDVIRVVARSDGGWYDGVRAGRRGWLPGNWVEEVVAAEAGARAAAGGRGVRPRAVVARL
jgi:hypothetical protein